MEPVRRRLTAHQRSDTRASEASLRSKKLNKSQPELQERCGQESCVDQGGGGGGRGGRGRV